MSKGRSIEILASLMAILGPAAGAPGRIQQYLSTIPFQNASLARDRFGLIWMAAKEGVFRFDGKHYLVVPGYPFHSARFVAADSENTIWAGGPEGLATCRHSNWNVVLHAPVMGMAIGSRGLWIDAGGLRLLESGEKERRFDRVQPSGQLLVDSDDALWFPCGVNVCTLRPPDWRLETQSIPVPGNWKKVVPERGGHRYWLSTVDDVALIEDGKLRSIQQASNPSGIPSAFPTLLDPDLSPDGKVWGTRFHLQPLAGLNIWSTGPAASHCSLFEGQLTRWFCAGDYLAKSVVGSGWETWAGEAFTSLSVSAFMRREGQAPLLATDRGVLDLKEISAAPSSGNAPVKRDVLNIINDGHGAYWLATRDEGLIRTAKDGRVLERFPAICPSIDTIRALMTDGRGRTWMGGKDPRCFYEIRGAPNNWRFIPQTLPEMTWQAVELVNDPDGRPWVGYEFGIAYLDDSGAWKRIATSEPVTLIRSLEFDGRDVIWVSRRRPGPFLRLQRNGSVWQVRSFSETAYPPANTMYLRRDSRGWIWRGTTENVLVARPGHFEPGEWLRLTEANGLATSVGVNLRGWYQDDSGDVWLGSNRGVTKVRPAPDWFAAPNSAKPIITRISVAGRTWWDPERMPQELAASSGPLEVDVSSMDANPFLEAPLRCRLTPSQDWKSTTDARLRFDALPMGSYALEATYNGDGAGPVLRWEFQVGNATTRYAFPILEFATLGLLGSWIFQRREWLNYRVRKAIFQFGRMLQPQDQSSRLPNYQGQTLNRRYKVSTALSRSALSTAYLATDRESGQKVVLKILNPNAGDERWIRQRFEHEIAALSMLNHPAIICLLDSWTGVKGELCLVTPYLEGPTLRRLIVEIGPLDPARAASIVEPLGAAMAAIHVRGIIHRDLKPENIIITDGDQPVVIDFGTSAARGPQGNLENTTTLSGSLHYLAPERVSGQYSPASDVYSLGVIVLEMLSGKRPAEMDADPSEPEFSQVVSRWADAAVAAKIREALHHIPRQRPTDVEAWAKELATLLRDYSTKRHPGGTPT